MARLRTVRLAMWNSMSSDRMCEKMDSATFRPASCATGVNAMARPSLASPLTALHTPDNRMA